MSALSGGYIVRAFYGDAKTSGTYESSASFARWKTAKAAFEEAIANGAHSVDLYLPYDHIATRRFITSRPIHDAEDPEPVSELSVAIARAHIAWARRYAPWLLKEEE